MTYTHLTPNELVMIEAYFKKGIAVLEAAKRLRRSRQAIYTVYNFLKLGKTATDYCQKYTENKTRCGRSPLVLPTEQQDYVRRLLKGAPRMSSLAEESFLSLVPLEPSIVTLKANNLM